MDEYRNANRSLWDEWTQINARSDLYRLEAFRAGENKLDDLVCSELGAVAGKSLLHLQCHFGMDTLSWARLGAVVTGVDFSPAAIALAGQLSQELQIPARFICSELYALPEQLAEQFDIVFTSYGVLTWLPDIRGWAKLVARYLRPGGVFYIAEFHPFAMVFSDAVSSPDWRVELDYFDAAPTAFPVQGSYADRAAEINQTISYEWQHTLGDIVTALIEAGLTIEFLHEHDHTVYEMFPFVRREADGRWRLPPGMPRVPLMFSLRAHR
ncbi:MAG TPA: class I SAM-dependent methyltransferase [Anaerolineaceae bacterium]|jgi:SAM-dependent methyltransferase|nr:class I SAM-dependent methyltransferase [Anaerolineaceae bacterium]